MKNWNGSKGIFKGLFSSDLTRYVRNEGGMICKMWKPNKYQNQDERYEQELEETKCNQELIVDAFNTIQKCDKLPSQLLEENMELLGILNSVINNFYPTTNKEVIIMQNTRELINKISK